MINFGIDLGTTNSAIAKFEKGQVVVFRNPIGQKDTLPSVVAFRKDRIIVGEKAREFMLKTPDQVAGSFKRKMGTTETYWISTLEDSKTPVELSALVLKELKNFIHTGENIDAAVITIPASFDTIQSNATKKAGHLAGFEQVVLLQEPIAASLAYANQDETEKFEEGQWLVYDLGGGTFDVALVKIQDGEMKVVDHEGDNFLGGNDFDKGIVEKIIVPYLEEQGNFHNLLNELKSAKGKYNHLYYNLLYKAEEAKLQLSASEIAEIEFETTDDDGNHIDGFLAITQADLEKVMEPYLARTIQMMEDIIQRNQVKPNHIKFVLMVGGSTYSPFIRQEVGRRLELEVNTRIDPTTAVAVGAAFYAGTKPKKVGADSTPENQEEAQILVKMAYQKASQDESEYFTARFTGETEGLFYRITRMDGGFDSGLKPLQAQIREDLPLIKDNFNQFDLKVYDEQNNLIPTDATPIGIAQGRYSVVGQPLPNDICLEVDDIENNTTALEVIFEKNTILPAKRTFTKQITRTLAKGSDERVTITVLEGSRTALPAALQPIGFISISGKELSRDLVRGSDVEITLEISESRDLKIATYLMMTDQEYEDVFTPSERKVNVFRLHEELHTLAEKVRQEIRDAEDQDNYEAAQKMVDLEYEILDLADQTKNMSEDDITDDKFQIEDRKRKIAQRVDELTRDKLIIKIKNEYFETKRYMEFVIARYEPSEEDQQAYADIITT
ncbi:MAG: Hsp70 family protein, partial [Bacteroidetes bacterium]|nr:Hsp70 family protein [Bacteroidota bacterium]